LSSIRYIQGMMIRTILTQNWPANPCPEVTGAPAAAFHRYALEFRLGALIYGAAFLTFIANRQAPWMQQWHWPLLICMLVGLVLIVSAFVRYVRHWDEFQQRVVILAAAFTTPVVILALLFNLMLAEAGLAMSPGILSIVPLVSWPAFGYWLRRSAQ
jgi:hypothetical protein